MNAVLSRTLLAAALLQCPAIWSASVLMISIDGMRPDAVIHADEHGLKLPNLQRFVNEGVYATGVTGVVPTVTFPSHTTLITGVWPAQHGIYSNNTFDPFSDTQRFLVLAGHSSSYVVAGGRSGRYRDSERQLARDGCR